MPCIHPLRSSSCKISQSSTTTTSATLP
jgi:hypothetical protein